MARFRKKRVDMSRGAALRQRSRDVERRGRVPAVEGELRLNSHVTIVAQRRRDVTALLFSVDGGVTRCTISTPDGSLAIRCLLLVDDASASKVDGTRTWIDWARGVVSAERRLELSQVEVRLLSALLAGDGTPVSPAELIAHAWP